MLHIIYGTDRERVHKKARDRADGIASDRVRITDAHTLNDLASVLNGPGMFGAPRVIMLEYTFARDDMRSLIESSIEAIHASSDTVILVEEKFDAATKKKLAPFLSDPIDMPKKAASSSVFAVSNAFKRRDRKATWIAYQEALPDSAPEAIHGLLFWAAKDMLLKSRSNSECAWARSQVKTLVALPHEARRRGETLECALEAFVLTNV